MQTAKAASDNRDFLHEYAKNPQVQQSARAAIHHQYQ
jgi:hypothetical protein